MAPALEATTDPKLAQAQLAIAREHGFPGWARLAAWLTRGEIPAAHGGQVELFAVRDWRVGRAVRDALAAAGPGGGQADPAAGRGALGRWVRTSDELAPSNAAATRWSEQG
jgi:hypothetical protein